MDKKLRRQYGPACAGLFLVALAGPVSAWSDRQQLPDPSVLDRGRYLVMVTGCNDCHTSGYMVAEGKIPEAQWLTGDSFGWRGPWGTTYAKNLRLTASKLSEDEWVAFTRNLRARPPMPWFNLNVMEEGDLQAIYHFIRSLGPAGEAAPEFLPPDQEPQPPFAVFPSAEAE